MSPGGRQWRRTFSNSLSPESQLRRGLETRAPAPDLGFVLASAIDMVSKSKVLTRALPVRPSLTKQISERSKTERVVSLHPFQ
ncbi:hypothetical protein CMUS01_04955 [Colletotrichum musicola]|uniref:Uncharacterized protein n=1 Tax=Colletotrichum musicola TaxID=2175873 RepID=A0A8H6KU84_9PEZI|nr:hypothetical protein CMUS01_04955 [Colletotrichum musicola]